MQGTIRKIALVAALLSAAAVPQAALAAYTLTDLGSFGGNYSTGYGINQLGQVTGTALGDYIPGEGRPSPAFIYTAGEMVSIISDPIAHGLAYGWAINDAGQVAGFSAPIVGGFAKAFLYSNGTFTQLAGFGREYNYSLATAINSAGVVVGYFGDNYYSNAFIYSNGIATNLGTGQAWGINSTGQIVIADVLSNGVSQGTSIYQNGSVTQLPTLGGVGVFGRAINEAGQVAGSVDTAGGDTHAFIYDSGQIVDLGTLGGTLSYSAAWAINNSGQVTGGSLTGDGLNTSEPDYHAFLYTNGSMVDLNSLIDPLSPLAMYVTLTEGRAINDNGWIVANGVDSRTGYQHAYLLATSPVPLPAAVWLLLSGIGGLGALARRNRIRPSAT